MWKLCFLAALSNFVLVASVFENRIDEDAISQAKNFIFWPNATIPFYINPEHFDHEQSLTIMTTLSVFAYKTCLKFAPVLVIPKLNQHVLVFSNPGGVKECSITKEGHDVSTPHYISLGYNCLKQPMLNLIIMRALGFPFEHNRAIRDYYINVNKENIEPNALTLFEKEDILPEGLRELPYDINSVMHFSERDFSKNGHRTIMFKNEVVQKRLDLSETDIRKIELIYRPECTKRDRQEKVELCQSYPGLRRKREIESSAGNSDDGNQRQSQRKSLRVNPDITAPPNITDLEDLKLTEQPIDLPDFPESIIELGIQAEMQTLMEYVYKMSSTALKTARNKYCKDDTLKETARSNQPVDALGVIEVVAKYTKSIVDDAVANLTQFCETSASVDMYNKLRCFGCDPNYSTKHGPPMLYTQHRPWIRQSTKHHSGFVSRSYEKSVLNRRSADDEGHMKQTDEHAQSAGTEQKNVGNVENLKGALRSRTTIKGGSVYAEERSNYPKNERRYQGGEWTLRKHTGLPHPDRGYAYEKKGRYYQSEEKPYRDKAVIKKQYIQSENRGYATPEMSQSKIVSEESLKPVEEPQSKEMYIDNERIAVNEYNTKADYAEKKTLAASDLIYSNEEKDKSYQSKENAKRIISAPRTVALSKINQEFYNQRKWPNNVVPYIISGNGTFDIEDVRSRLNAVNKILKEKTCASIEEISEQEARSLEDYLVLEATPDYVTGRVGGRQSFGVIELLEGGQPKQHTAMVVMAMLGFYFEVCRHDRDQYIVVHNRHIRPDKLHHFEKIREDATLNLPYDYKSATHPSWQFWRKLGKKGIASVATFKHMDPDGALMKSLGQNPELLSEIDIIKINSVYGTDCYAKSKRRREWRRLPESRR